MAQNICCINPEPLCIPLYRNQYIDIKLNELYGTFGLKNNTCPVDCVKLLNSLKTIPRMVSHRYVHESINVPILPKRSYKNPRRKMPSVRNLYI